MSEPELARCHCIIAHPDKPKFMVIEHAEQQWMPPTLRFPVDQPLDSQVKVLIDGMARKYGLNVTVLRHVFESRNYHCIEMEVQSRPMRPLKAVWVGRKEYKQFRATDPNLPDTLEDWLKQAGRPNVSQFRRAWERPDWFRAASRWIHQELDRLGMQATGTVQQFKALGSESCILNIKVTGSNVWFKASSPVSPNEAVLVRHLAATFPELVPAPLAADEQNIWMLTADLGKPLRSDCTDAETEAALLAMGKVQSSIAADRKPWRELGVPDLGLRKLGVFLNGESRDLDKLLVSKAAFNREEFDRLWAYCGRLGDRVEELAAFGIPETLLHADFRPGNVYLADEGIQLWDWAGSTISHPFFVLDRWKIQTGRSPASLDGYLNCFSDWGSLPELQKAWSLAQELAVAWHMLRWLCLLPFVEDETAGWYRVRNSIRIQARALLEQSDG